MVIGSEKGGTGLSSLTAGVKQGMGWEGGAFNAACVFGGCTFLSGLSASNRAKQPADRLFSRREALVYVLLVHPNSLSFFELSGNELTAPFYSR